MSEALNIPYREGRRSTDSHHARQRGNQSSARPDEWSLHMPHIKSLYIDENRPLKEVMRIMARDYNFHATYEPITTFICVARVSLGSNHWQFCREKVYKSRLKSFGLRKNVVLREKDLPQVLQLVSRARRAENYGRDSKVKLATGQVVSLGRLTSHLKRKATPGQDGHFTDLDLAAVYYLSGADPMLPRNMDAPDAIRLPQLIFSDVANYVSMRFGVVRLPQFVFSNAGSSYVSMRFGVSTGSSTLEIPPPVYPPASQALSTIENVSHLLANGEIQAAIAQLQVVPQRINLLLEDGNIEPPLTLMLIWKTIVSLIEAATTARAEVVGVVKSLVRYTASKATASRSISPQFQRIVSALSELSQIDGPLLYETAARAWICTYAQHDIIRESSSCLHFVCQFGWHSVIPLILLPRTTHPGPWLGRIATDPTMIYKFWNLFHDA